MLRRLPHAMGYNYSLLDANGVAAVVEAVPGSVAVRTGDWLACTNHFNRRCSGRSIAAQRIRSSDWGRWKHGPRKARVRKLCLRPSTAPPRRPFTMAIFGAPERCHHCRRAGEEALADRHRRRRRSLEEDMLDVDFSRWLGGEDLAADHLDGHLGGLSKPFEWPITRKRKAIRP